MQSQQALRVLRHYAAAYRHDADPFGADDLIDALRLFAADDELIDATAAGDLELSPEWRVHLAPRERTRRAGGRGLARRARRTFACRSLSAPWATFGGRWRDCRASGVVVATRRPPPNHKPGAAVATADPPQSTALDRRGVPRGDSEPRGRSGWGGRPGWRSPRRCWRRCGAWR